jgi:hypothetical protein
MGPSGGAGVASPAFKFTLTVVLIGLPAISIYKIFLAKLALLVAG